MYRFSMMLHLPSQWSLTFEVRKRRLFLPRSGQLTGRNGA